jgi:hypothetical protein
MRNLFTLAGFNATPYVGIRQRQQDFKMSDHVSPSQFYLERFCLNPNSGGAWPTSSDGRLVCADINIANNAAGWGVTIGAGDLYYIDGNGDVINGAPAWANGAGDLTIPGVVNYGGQNYYNLLYGDLIADDDFCYYTPNSIANGYSMVCMNKGANRLNLVAAFGGAALLENDTQGVTHIYNVNWLGPYVGLGLEKALSPLQTLKLYGEIFVPIYKAEGIWPYRSDWKQDPSFVDKGGTSWGFLLDATYKYRIRSNIEVTFGGQYEYLQAGGADTELYLTDGSTIDLPGSILKAKWRNYSLLFGVSFKL